MKITRKKFYVKILLLLSCLILNLGVGTKINSVNATSRSNTFNFNGGSITANAWIQSFASGGCGEFQTSADVNSSSVPKFTRIAWSFYALGISAGASYNGISASVSGSGSSPGSSWTNTNSRHSSFRGRVCGTGLAFYVGYTATATADVASVPRSTTVKI